MNKSCSLYLLVLFAFCNIEKIHPNSGKDHIQAPMMDFEPILEDGIKIGCGGNWETALEHFDFVINHAREDSSEMGLALIGKVLAYASLGNKEGIYDNIILVKRYSQHKWGDHGKTFELPKEYLFAPNEFDEEDYKRKTEVKFANPEERINPAECKSRARGIANNLMSLVENQVKKLTVKNIYGRREWLTDDDKKEILAMFREFIDDLISKAEFCCNQCINDNIWTKCVTPIFERFYKWAYLGIPQDPR